jgi:DNA-binding transcriptional LysR family regulator
MDRLDAMATFVAVLDEGGFSAASRRLGMPLATVSRKVAELEARLGAALLIRTTRHVAATEAGRGFAVTARRLIEELAEAERLVAGEYSTPRGLLTVAAPMVLGRAHLLPILAGFLGAYPEVKVDLRLTQSNLNLAEEQLDVALTIGPAADSALRMVNLGQLRPVVVASPVYLARHGAPETVAALAEHQIISFAGHVTPITWDFRDGGRVALRPRLFVSTAEAAVDAAIAGMGVAQLLCHQVSGAVGEGRLSTLLRPHWAEPLPVQMVFAAGRTTPAKLRAFVDYVAPRLRPRLVFDP